MSQDQGPSNEYKAAAIQCQAVVSPEDFQQALEECNVGEVRRLLQIDRSLVNQPVGDSFPPLIDALWKGDGRTVMELVEMVQVFLDYQADVNARSEGSGWTALHVSVFCNWVEVVELLLQNEADVNVRDKRGQTPLWFVESVEMARLLIAHGADVNCKDKIGETPVVRIVGTNMELARWLIANGADVNCLDHDGYPIWFYGMHKYGHFCDVKILKVFLEHVVDQDLHAKWGEDGRSALHFAAGYGERGSLDIMEYLLDQGLDVNARATAGGETPLHFAVRGYAYAEDALPRVQLLLQHGADVNAADHDGRTPFVSMCFCSDQATDLAKLLIDHGADISRDGKIRLLKAAQEDDSSLVKLILEQGKFDLNARDSADSDTLAFQMLDSKLGEENPFRIRPYRPMFMWLIEQGADLKAKHQQSGRTLLHFAVAGYKLMEASKLDEQLLLEKGSEFDLEVQLLLEKGSDVNARDNEGRTPLLDACDYGHWMIARILVDHGADVHIASEDHGTPLSKACLRNEESIVQLLLDAGAEVDFRLKDDITSLLICVEEGFISCATTLLGRGADINAADNEGWTPLLFAIQNDNWEMANMLVDHGADVNMALEDYCTPLLLACIINEERVAELLMDAGAHVDYRLKDDVTALLFCVKRGLIGCAALLLNRGADIHAGNRKGYTPFLVACTEGKLDMIYGLIRLSPHHRRLGLLSQVSYPCTSTVADDDDSDWYDF